MVKFTLKGTDLKPGNMEMIACFGWNGVSSIPASLHVLNTSVDSVTLGAIVPAALVDSGPSWCDRIGIGCQNGFKGTYEGWGLVPLAELRILGRGTGGGTGEWKRFEGTIPVGITLRWIAALIAGCAVILAWVVVLKLARSRPAIQGNPVLRIFTNSNGYASLSQFQITLWTFTVGASAIYVMALSGTLIDVPTQMLALLGISGAAVLGASLPGANAANTEARSGSTSMPGVVGNFNVMGTAGATTVVLIWRAPATGTAAIAYTLEQSSDGGATWTPLGGTSDTMYPVTGLAPATLYGFRVTGIDAEGTPGSPSATLAVRTSTAPATPTPPPAAPQTVAAVGPSNPSAVNLEWSAVAPAPEGYAVQYRNVNGGTWITAPTVTSGKYYRLPGLKPNAAYEARVAAIAGGVLGPWSMPSLPFHTPMRLPQWADLVIWDGKSEVDVTRIQMLLFTLIAAGFVLLTIGNENVIPEIPASIVLLMGISNGVYLTAKFIPRQG